METTIIRRPASFRLRANKVTKAAIKEAKNRKVYPENELYSSAEEMFKSLNAEIDAGKYSHRANTRRTTSVIATNLRS